MSNAKIFVIYHKPEELIKNDIYTPIAVGDNKSSFSDEFLKDDIGDNIAEKNDTYNELTAIYWVYKHLDEFEDTKYIGFCHYRRLFAFSNLRYPVYVRKNIDYTYIGVNEEKMDNFFSDFDLIAPYPVRNKTVRKHYEKSHNKEDLDVALKIINSKYPQLYKTAKEYIDNNCEYLYNMFVFKKENFVEYSKFLFDVLDEFTKEKGGDRLYVSERLTGIYISYLINKGLKPFYVPIYNVRKKNHKAAKEAVKENKRIGKDNGFIFKYKPLILYYLPRCLEEFLRRRITK